ncbi:MAG: isoprenyl transferase [Bacteroidia bacterium]|nr:isoprenyl transferase [Bacteroidia bacterium]
MEHKEIDIEKVPQHVALIMDGNGRWAKRKGLSRLIGHEYGVGSVREIVEAAAKIGIKYLTLYTFSKENWNRPVLEVSGLMSLLVKTIRKEIKTLTENEIRLQIIGDVSELASEVRAQLNEAVVNTQTHSGITVILAINYSAKWDITKAIRNISEKVKSNEISSEQIDEHLIAQSLSTAQFPEPELIIRTGGEQRISNFLLWESAYSEFYFTPIFWPDFKKEHFYQAILDYQNRERRFGKTSEQLVNEK